MRGGEATESQLKKYYEAVHERFPQEIHPGYLHLFLFLTQDGSSPAQHRTHDMDEGADWARAWACMGYRDLEPTLERMLTQIRWHGRRQALKIVEDFYFDAQRRQSTDAAQLAATLFGLTGDEDERPADSLDRELTALTLATAPDLMSDSNLPDQRWRDLRNQVEELGAETLDAYGTAVTQRLRDDRFTSVHLHEALVMLWQSVVNKAIQDHTPSEAVQDMIVRITEHFTASPFDPGRRAPIKREIAEKIGFSWLERTRGKGQGLKWRRGQSDQSKPYPFFSGDYKQSMPNDPGALLKEVMKAKGIVTAEQKSVPYWEEHFDELTDLLEIWLEKEHTARSAAPPVE